eukprot:4661320-Pleurochrysis_carterae.AAC.1
MRKKRREKEDRCYFDFVLMKQTGIREAVTIRIRPSHTPPALYNATAYPDMARSCFDNIYNNSASHSKTDTSYDLE